MFYNFKFNENNYYLKAGELLINLIAPVYGDSNKGTDWSVSGKLDGTGSTPLITKIENSLCGIEMDVAKVINDKLYFSLIARERPISNTNWLHFTIDQAQGTIQANGQYLTLITDTDTDTWQAYLGADITRWTIDPISAD